MDWNENTIAYVASLNATDRRWILYFSGRQPYPYGEDKPTIARQSEIQTAYLASFCATVAAEHDADIAAEKRHTQECERGARIGIRAPRNHYFRA